MKTEIEFDWANPELFESARKEMSATHDAFVSKWKGNSEYLEDPVKLKEALDEYENISRKYSFGGAEGYYYYMKQELDGTDLDARAKFNSLYEFILMEDNKLIFFALSLGKISKEKQKEFLESSELTDYRNFLKEIFVNSKYMLEEKEEMIMGLKSTPAHEMWERMVTSLLSKESAEIKGEKKTYPELLSLMKDSDSELRDLAKEAFEKILEKYSDVAENEINAILENHKSNMIIRGYEEVDSSRLISDSVSKDFVLALLNATTKRFDLSDRYYKLKAKVLGKDKIGYHERATQVGNFSRKYSYEDGVETVRKVLGDIDPEFLGIFEKFVADGRIDAYSRKGKRSGAACYHTSIGLPTNIILNHNGTLDDVTTIAHEVGHGINNEMMRKAQHALYFDTPVATAEVASTFFEDFVLEEVLKDCDDEEKFSILMKKVDDDMSSIMRQVSAYNFELELHNTYQKEGYLSKEKIGKIFAKHMGAYLGEGVDISTVDNWWIYWGHFRSCFYVYSYASGLLISKSMQKKFKEDSGFIEKIKEFLSSGTSLSPEEIFDKMGIKPNEEFFLNGISEIESSLVKAEELAQKLGKI